MRVHVSVPDAVVGRGYQHRVAIEPGTDYRTGLTEYRVYLRGSRLMIGFYPEFPSEPQLSELVTLHRQTCAILGRPYFVRK